MQPLWGTRPCSDGETDGSAAPLLIQTVRNFSRLCEFVVWGVLGPTGAAMSDASVFRDRAARRPTVNKLFQVWILASEHLTLKVFLRCRSYSFTQPAIRRRVAPCEPGLAEVYFLLKGVLLALGVCKVPTLPLDLSRSCINKVKLNFIELILKYDPMFTLDC